MPPIPGVANYAEERSSAGGDSNSGYMSIQETKTTTEKIEEKRNDLEALIETDLPAAELAEALLEVANGEK